MGPATLIQETGVPEPSSLILMLSAVPIADTQLGGDTRPRHSRSAQLNRFLAIPLMGRKCRPTALRITLSLMVRVPGLVIHAGSVAISAHLIFESAAYAVSFSIYAHDRRRRGDPISGPNRNSVIVAAILGAAFGSKLLAWLGDPGAVLRRSLPLIIGGKTIVGGLLGGTIAVEWVKARLGIAERTGDLFAIPVTLGTAIGRLGCFFGGIEDHTYGVPSKLPWAVDFGDGMSRHPVQLYEVIFLIVLAGTLVILRRCSLRNGELYRVFLFSYLAWRFAIDFLKPELVFGGLTSIQWACLAALLWYSRDIAQILSRRWRVVAHG